MSILRKSRESTTLQLLMPALAVVGYRFATDVGMSANDFATAYAILMGIWLGREWRSAHYANKD